MSNIQSELFQIALNLANPEQINSYQKNGAVCLRQALCNDEIECLRKGIDLNLQNLSSRAKIASQREDPGLFVEDFCNWQNNNFYKKFIFESPIAQISRLLMNSKISRLYHDHTLVKEAGTQQRTPWHQDQPYYNIEGRQNCSFWIAVDSVSRQSTLEFIAGSHLGPWLMPRSFMNNEAKWFPEGSLQEIPDIETDRAKFPIIGWEVNPGDIVCFHMLTLHAAGGVAGMQRRRVFSVRFLGDDVTYAPRPWVTSPEFSGLDKRLIAGTPLEHEMFPAI